MVARGMKFIHRGFVILSLISLGSTLPVIGAPVTKTPDAVVQALYQSSLDHFGFSPESVKLSKPWVTPDLYARLWKKVNEPQPKDAAPDIEGDLFMDCQEPPTKFEIGKVSPADTKAKIVEVGVTLFFAGDKRHYTVQMEQIGGAWKVSDVDYGKDGKLTDLLK
jgi:hypothetical protein